MGVLDKLRDARTAIADHEAAKTAEELERREAERDPAVVEAAQMLGMKESEIVSVDEADEGLVIVTHDGVHLVLVAPDHPDALGKVGLMFLDKPAADMVTDFPVYARDVDDTAAEPETVEGDPAVEDEPPLEKRSKRALADMIEKLNADGAGIEVPAKATKADLVALLQAAS